MLAIWKKFILPQKKKHFKTLKNMIIDTAGKQLFESFTIFQKGAKQCHVQNTGI